MKQTNALRLTGATILRAHELVRDDICISDGVITDGNGVDVNLSGYLVLPGIIDLHGDAFERHILPRPRAAFSMDQGLVSTDREAAANGITTAWMAQSWSWEGGHRSPDFAEAFLQALEVYRTRMQTDLRVQIRCETHTVETLARLIEMIRHHRVDYVIFNNHLDEMLQVLETSEDELAHWAKSVGRPVEVHRAMILDAADQKNKVPRYICALARAFDEMGVRYGSHDDRDGETRETYAMIGARICEFPLTRNVAKMAFLQGDPVLMGAPNVVRGGSQSGNVAAMELIEAGCCDALVSDYYYPALSRAAFSMSDAGVRTLGEAWNMISAAPAQIMGLTDRGSIAHGKRADLTIINRETREVEATLVAGRITHMTGEAARRFMGSPNGMSLAAE